jgi:hypothetical protein
MRTDTDPRLIKALRDLGDSYGPLGVALAAADLTDANVLITILSGEIPLDSPEPVEPPSLADDIAAVLNRHCAENASNTPDFILAQFMLGSLNAFEVASVHREQWYGKRLSIGGVVTDLTPEDGPS